jgi:hypothetical protein
MCCINLLWFLRFLITRKVQLIVQLHKGLSINSTLTMRFENPEVIATWPAPNHVNPEERGPALYIIASIVFFLAVVAVFTRLCVRLFVRKWLGPDDALIFLALVSLLGLYTHV